MINNASIFVIQAAFHLCTSINVRAPIRGNRVLIALHLNFIPCNQYFYLFFTFISRQIVYNSTVILSALVRYTRLRSSMYQDFGQFENNIP